MSRRRPRRGPLRCKDCNRPIALLTNPHTGHGVMSFDERQVDARSYSGESYAVEGRRAWREADLVEALMDRLGLNRAAAEDMAAGYPHQPVHRCPPGTSGSDDTREEHP